MRCIVLLLAALVILAACLDVYCDLSAWRGGVALRCAGHDPVRIWPWPPIAPWFEDPPLPDPFFPLTMNTRSAILKM